MKEYEFVEVTPEGGLLKPFNYKDYRQIVDRYARNGYRFVGYVPTEIIGGNGGTIVKMDLVFEKDV